MASSVEWTLDQARACWKPMVRPVQHVGVPGYSFQTGVMWDGALVFGPLGFRELKVMQQETAPLGDSLMHVSVAFGNPPRFADRKGTGSPTIRRWLDGGRLPMPTVETRDGDLVWQESVFAHLLGRSCADGLRPRASDVLVTQVGFRVRNAGHGQADAHLWLHFGDTSKVTLGYKCSQADELGAALPLTPAEAATGAPLSATPCASAILGMAGDRVRYVVQAPTSGTLRRHASVSYGRGVTSPGAGVLEWSASLAPGAEAVLRLAIPYGLVDRRTGERMLKLDADRVRHEVRRFWRKLTDGAGQITTPDPFVNDYLVAVAGQMAQQTAYRRSTDVWMYKTSPNHYEGYWPCNAARALPAFDLRGLSDLNVRVLEGFIKSQTDDIGGLDRRSMGSGERLAAEGYAKQFGFLGNFGEWTANPLLLSHGLGMWALASHYRITRDDAWLYGGPNKAAEGAAGSPLRAVIAGFDWLASQRRRTMREEGGRRVEHWGLLPAASAHDWLAGNTIFNDAYCIFGMAEVARLMREIGHPRAGEMLAEVAAYRSCLRDRYVAARDRARTVPMPDGSALPFVPRMVQELDWTKLDWTYTGYGPLRAGAWGALDPYDELVTQSLAFLEEGMPKGEGAYFSAHVSGADIADANWADISDPEAARHYIWRHYVEYETMWPIGSALFLARDDLPRYFEWLAHNFAVVLHRDWRVGVESLDGVPSCAPGDSERWQAVRRMFVNERGGYDGSEQSLWLLQAIPREWLRPGSVLSVRKMGTWFGGTVDLDVRVADDGRSVTMVAKLRNLRVTPKALCLRLRSGSGAPLASATVNGKPVAVGKGDTVALPPVRDAVYRVKGTFAAE